MSFMFIADHIDIATSEMRDSEGTLEKNASILLQTTGLLLAIYRSHSHIFFQLRKLTLWFACWLLRPKINLTL